VTPAPSSASLGFAIPVYRRPEMLDLALASVVPQAARIGAPIYITDNACDATNVEVVRRWRERFAGIVHEINETNLGIDGNVDRAISRCPADYVLVIGDDDVLMPGLVDAVASILAVARPPHIVCAYQYLDNRHRPITGRPVFAVGSASAAFRRVVVDGGWALGFIGAHVFERARYSACRHDAMGSYFNHLSKLIHYLGPDEEVSCIDAPLVGNRADDESTPTWSGDRLNVVFGLEITLRSAMRQAAYCPDEVEAAVRNARHRLGYAQSVRLLYWAALAEATGRGEGYWRSLEALLPRRHRWLRRCPRPALRAIGALFPLLRQLKRRVAKQGAGTVGA
jgi:glycosyltransferase involved in cell wall biosynthesis